MRNGCMLSCMWFMMFVVRARFVFNCVSYVMCYGSCSGVCCCSVTCVFCVYVVSLLFMCVCVYGVCAFLCVFCGVRCVCVRLSMRVCAMCVMRCGCVCLLFLVLIMCYVSC